MLHTLGVFLQILVIELEGGSDFLEKMKHIKREEDNDTRKERIGVTYVR